MALLDRLTRTIADATRLTQALMEDPSRRMPPERPPEPAQPSLPGPEGARAPEPAVPAGVAERARVRAAAEQAYAKASGVRPAGAKRPAPAVKEEPAKKKEAAPPKKKEAAPPKKKEPAKKKAPAKKAPAKKKTSAKKAASPLHRGALDALHQPVMVVSPDRQILYANPAMCRYLGLVTGRDWTPQQLEGEEARSVHPSLRGEGAAPAVGGLAFAARESRLEQDGELIGYVLERIPVGFAT